MREKQLRVRVESSPGTGQADKLESEAIGLLPEFKKEISACSHSSGTSGATGGRAPKQCCSKGNYTLK